MLCEHQSVITEQPMTNPISGRLGLWAVHPCFFKCICMERCRCVPRSHIKVVMFASVSISCACNCRENPERGSRICPEGWGSTWWRRRLFEEGAKGRNYSFLLVEAGCSYSGSAEKTQKRVSETGNFKGHCMICIIPCRAVMSGLGGTRGYRKKWRLIDKPDLWNERCFLRDRFM